MQGTILYCTKTAESTTHSDNEVKPFYFKETNNTGISKRSCEVEQLDGTEAGMWRDSCPIITALSNVASNIKLHI